MSNLQMWALIVGFFMPVVLSIIVQTGWSTQIQAVLTFLASLVAGAGTAYFQGDLTGKRFVEASLVVLVTAVATYHGSWKPSGIAPAIEAKTNLSGAPT